MATKLVHTHRFNATPLENGGESVEIITEFYDNGDDKNNIFTCQKIILNSYCNRAVLEVTSSPLTPQTLRKLAKELVQIQCDLVG